MVSRGLSTNWSASRLANCFSCSISTAVACRGLPSFASSCLKDNETDCEADRPAAASETWLVVLGGALFGAFPSVYAIALHALYLIVMIFCAGLSRRRLRVPRAFAGAAAVGLRRRRRERPAQKIITIR